ncbi:MAG: beta-N-acetylglucosaminidase domain-containing protein [SAR324 cluster bacterium]|nr:beta-N-acetylglucosaminidase domain-containing protein [SAR324 cluster bacterium]
MVEKTNDYQFYIYAPKDDPFLRRKWEERWPDEKSEKIKELADHYHQAGLRFGIGLSPYEIYIDYGPRTKTKLYKKIQELNEISCDILCILFDDMRGDVASLAETQAEIVHVIAEATDAYMILMCPTYYSHDPILTKVFGQMPKNYLKDLGRILSSQVQILWTGPQVCSQEYPEAHLEEVTFLFRREPFLWDNYPVNDSANMSKYLHLRAFEHKTAPLWEWTKGHAVNPMNQSWLSRIPLHTLPKCYQKGNQYQPLDAFSKACYDLCGEELARHIIDDLENFQDLGLDGLSAEVRQNLISKYQKYGNSPYALEIIAWLHGKYKFDPACLTS